MAPTPPHPEVLIRPAFLSLHLGEEARLVLTVGRAQEPLDTSEAGVEWHSTHPEVVEVTAEGVVRALGKGRARIRAVGADFMVSATVRVR